MSALAHHLQRFTAEIYIGKTAALLLLAIVCIVYIVATLYVGKGLGGKHVSAEVREASHETSKEQTPSRANIVAGGDSSVADGLFSHTNKLSQHHLKQKETKANHTHRTLTRTHEGKHSCIHTHTHSSLCSSRGLTDCAGLCPLCLLLVCYTVQRCKHCMQTHTSPPRQCTHQ
jgi:hypothetical protein